MPDPPIPANDPLPGSHEGAKVLTTALAQLDDAVLLVRPTTREIVGCNPATERLFGYQASELLGQSTEVLHVSHEHFEEFGRVTHEALERGEEFSGNWEMRRKDGSIVPTFHVVSLIDEALGLGGGVVSLVRDCSVLHDAVSALGELEHRYQVLFDDNPEPMFVYDVATGELIAVNRALAEAYGAEPGEMLGRRIEGMVAAEEREKIRHFLAQPHPDSGRTEVWRAPRRDGEIRVIRTNSKAVTFGGKASRLVVVTDLTERRHAEMLAQRLLAILEATPDFVGIASQDETVQFVNSAGLRMLGMENVEASGTRIADYVAPGSLALLRGEAFPVALREGAWTGSTSLRHKSGDEIPVSQVVIAHDDPEDSTVYLSTIARDLREHTHLEGQLRQAQKMEAIGRLAGGIAHDFNNILTALIGYGELVLAAADKPEVVRRNVSQMLRATHRATELTRGLLTFSRHQVLTKKRIDLNDIVRETEVLLRHTIGETIRFETDLACTNAAVEADPTQLQQVLVNLAVNARDAMPEGGSLRFATETLTLDRFLRRQRATVAPGEYVVLRVTDSGAGMEPEILSQIFEPFFTTKEAGQGTGLGLATAYATIDQSGGFLDVDSEPGRGSTFTIYLPRVLGKGESSTRQKPSSTPVNGHGTILVVEDDEAVQDLAREILQQGGYSVVCAGCAIEALAIQDRLKRSFDVLVTDIVLPRMDGRELARRLRLQGVSAPVVFISGYDAAALRNGLPLEPGTPLLRKPFSPSDLLEAVARVLASCPLLETPGSGSGGDPAASQPGT